MNFKTWLEIALSGDNRFSRRVARWQQPVVKKTLDDRFGPSIKEPDWSKIENLAKLIMPICEEMGLTWKGELNELAILDRLESEFNQCYKNLENEEDLQYFKKDLQTIKLALPELFPIVKKVDTGDFDKRDIEQIKKAENLFTLSNDIALPLPELHLSLTNILRYCRY